MRLAKTSAADMSAALPTEKAAAFAVSGFNVPARRYDAIAFPRPPSPPHRREQPEPLCIPRWGAMVRRPSFDPEDTLRTQQGMTQECER